MPGSARTTTMAAETGAHVTHTTEITMMNTMLSGSPASTQPTCDAPVVDAAAALERAINGREQAECDLRESTARYEALVRLSCDQSDEHDAQLRLARLLAKFAQSALSIKEIPALLNGAIATVIDGLGADCAAVLRFSAQGHEMSIEAGSVWDGSSITGLCAYSGFATPDAFLHKRAKSLATCSVVTESDGTLSDFFEARGIVTRLESIIGSLEAPYGVLGAYSKKHDTFRAASASFLQSVAGLVGVAIGHMQVEQSFAYLAQYDALTNLANRNLFRDQLAQQLIVAAADGSSVAVFYIDLDGFKDVNDAHGHDCGDRLLVLVAERLRACVPDNGTIGRQGGDEFAVMVGNLADSAHALLIAEHLCENLGRPFNLDGRETCITASIGVVVSPADGLTADLLIKNADTAMYQGKQQGRNNFRSYSILLDAVAIKRRSLVVELYKAGMEEEFELHYQPQVSLKDGRVIGAEALLRWWHPTHGLLSAGEFIGVAEESGLISHIGAWVLETACKQVVEWQRTGFPDFHVSVNVSASEVRRGKLPGLVRCALAASGLAARHLELELTESGVTDDHEKFIQTLQPISTTAPSRKA